MLHCCGLSVSCNAMIRGRVTDKTTIHYYCILQASDDTKQAPPGSQACHELSSSAAHVNCIPTICFINAMLVADDLTCRKAQSTLKAAVFFARMLRVARLEQCHCHCITYYWVPAVARIKSRHNCA